MSESPSSSAPEPGWLQLKFWEMFEIDVRSLAVLRISLGVVILLDLLHRVSQIELLYTDAGILTREMSREYLGSGFWSLLWIDGSLVFAQAIFVLTALAAVALILGYQTRVATILCLVLVASIQFRNPLVLTGGHILLRVMLFWSMFLPLGAVRSLDSKWGPYKDPEKWRVASVATMGMMLQVACLYFFSGIAKLNGLWFGGEAVEYVMNLGMYVKPLGDSLRQIPLLLKAATWLTLVAELSVPFLLFAPRLFKYTRGMGMALFWLMHLAIGLTMSIGIFSLMAMACWLIFVPNSVWEAYTSRAGDSPWDYVIKLTPAKIVAQAFCGIALFLMLLLHVSNIGSKSVTTWMPTPLKTLANRMLIIQEFRLFGKPLRVSPAFEYEAFMKDLTKGDFFDEMMHPPGEPSTTEYEYFTSQYWRRIHSNLMDDTKNGPSPIVARMRNRLLERLVNRWNITHTEERAITEAKLLFHERPIYLNNVLGEQATTQWANWKDQ